MTPNRSASYRAVNLLRAQVSERTSATNTTVVVSRSSQFLQTTALRDFHKLRSRGVHGTDTGSDVERRRANVSEDADKEGITLASCRNVPQVLTGTVVPGKACRETSCRKSPQAAERRALPRKLSLRARNRASPNAGIYLPLGGLHPRCQNPPPPTLWMRIPTCGRHISTVTSVIRSKEPRRPAGTARQMLLQAGRRGGLPRVTRERESERKTVTVTVTPSVAYSEGMRSRATARGMKDQCHASYHILIARVTRPVPIYISRIIYMSRMNGFIKKEISVDRMFNSYCARQLFVSLMRAKVSYLWQCLNVTAAVLLARRAPPLASISLPPTLSRGSIQNGHINLIISSVIRLADEERLGTDVGYPYQEWCQCSLLCSLCYARLGPAPRRSSDGYRTLSSYSSPCLLGTPS
ncbi:hypothetical protein ALC53_09614 [Atta colombica]|uniref:Uncharacterized protein n=1 Tax=Atta colombica TaxID=520822 RepID=A0A151I151_9HYME|nr:hypothetical protein ALC53_09614 [Atta colombica]